MRLDLADCARCRDHTSGTVQTDDGAVRRTPAQGLLEELRKLLIYVLIDQRAHHFQARPVRDICRAILELLVDMGCDVARQQYQVGSAACLEGGTCPGI